jgi:hypothetical protein
MLLKFNAKRTPEGADKNGDLYVDARYCQWAIVIDGTVNYIGLYADFFVGDGNKLFITYRN